MFGSDAPLLSGDALRERFLALDAFLFAQQKIWREKPFIQQHLLWELDFPELSTWLRARSLADAEACHTQPTTVAAPQPYRAWAQQAAQLTHVGRFASVALNERPVRMSSGIAERKWQQIEAFASAVHGSAGQAFTQAQNWLDWCAGKGHLGRYLAWPDANLECLEFNPDLIGSGQAISHKYLAHAQHTLCDVMSAASTAPLQQANAVVALHACGDLHTHLVRQVGAQQAIALALAPCCYNRTQAEFYQPLSKQGQISKLQLTRDDLGLPLTATVTATARERRLRDQSMAWRLAFDILQRELRGIDDYLPTPSLSAAWFNKPFAQWCRDLAVLKNLAVVPERNWQMLEAQGWQRLAQVRNLELLRGLFRRPLELWLLLDQALFLQEQGFNVELGEFCAIELTPRNLLLLAQRS
ncbi:methyltransferase [Pseudomonas sp. C27(2019)]|uniref:methyltransferase n=1 Tax=Pseudomonas sp. C27(2019) TaxID=2604941 RepID=UPI0012441040|nr:methyltransferase [Pseudomonas sp. C27(2019)]QEY57723.1 methyltransferase [Pseudomonas sp. C27(2019)]